MNCPHCACMTTKKRAKKTKLGYAIFFCSNCQCLFNERTGTPYLECPTDIVLLAVLWRLRSKLSLRDVAEMFLERSIAFTHEAVRDWEERFAPLIADHLRIKRRGQAGTSWYVDETYRHASVERGAIFTGPLILVAIWWIRGSVKSGIGMRPNSSSNKLLLRLAMLQSRSPQTDIAPIHAQSARHSEMKLCIEQIST
jgi:transposase-like protein